MGGGIGTVLEVSDVPHADSDLGLDLGSMELRQIPSVGLIALNECLTGSEPISNRFHQSKLLSVARSMPAFSASSGSDPSPKTSSNYVLSPVQGNGLRPSRNSEVTSCEFLYQGF